MLLGSFFFMLGSLSLLVLHSFLLFLFAGLSLLDLFLQSIELTLGLI